MAQVRKSVVKEVTVKELMVGDKLLVNVLGYKDHVLFNQGAILNPKDISFIKEKLGAKAPTLSDEQIVTEKRATVDIKDRDGKILVKARDQIKEDAIQPLLEEGFRSTPIIGGSAVVFSRPQKWPEDAPWHIDAINPRIKVETMVTINDEIQEEPEVEERAKPKKKAAVGAGKAGT